MPTSSPRKVVLAYSGGLDTAVILRWLQQEYSAEVITFTADIGQGEETENARHRAESMGVTSIYIEDLREEFVRDFVFPMLRANTIYEGEYLLGTAIARPLIARRLVEIARLEGADAIAHGATGKGNDQIRFELGVAALAPDLHVVAPWREWQIRSRDQLLEYCAQHNITVAARPSGKAPYSMDANLLHVSYEGGELEDPWQTPPAQMWQRTKAPEEAPAEALELEVNFQGGDPVAIDDETLSPATLLERLNQLGGEHGIGRVDLVENRYLGIKSRGCYETPGGTLLLRARRAVESLTLDRQAAHLKDELMPRYAELIYNGYWWSPERRMLQAAIDNSQTMVNGTARLRLYRGGVQVVGRRSPQSLYDKRLATFGDDQDGYNQRDASGFIQLSRLRLRAAARQGD